MAPTEIFDDDKEQAAHAAETGLNAQKPKRTRAPRKPKAAPAGEIAPAAQSPDAPAKRTRARKKAPAKTEQAEPAATAQAVPDATAPAEPPKKTTRKRRAPAKKDGADATQTEQASVTAEALPAQGNAESALAADDTPAAPKPARAPRKRRTGTRSSAVQATAEQKIHAGENTVAAPGEEPAAPEKKSSAASKAPADAKDPVLSASPARETPAPRARRRGKRPAAPVSDVLSPAPLPPHAETGEPFSQATLPFEARNALTERVAAPTELPAAKTPAQLAVREANSTSFAKPPVVDDFSSIPEGKKQATPAENAEPRAGAEESSRRRHSRHVGRGRQKSAPESVETPALVQNQTPPPALSDEKDAASKEPAVLPAPGEENHQEPRENTTGHPRSRSARRRAAAARRKAEAHAAQATQLSTRDGDSAAPESRPIVPAPQQDEEDLSPAKTADGPDRKMLVSVLPDELVEVVLLEDGIVAEYYVEMVHQAKIRGNIYKGVVSNIDPNLQAAFVNFGNAKNGFLQIDEVHPEYWLTHHDPEKGGKYPSIQKVMKSGQEVLVQVVKEPNGSKGAFLTTWVSLAGRFLVLTPGQEQIGISRKVEDGEERNRLRELIKGLNPGEGLGAIVRTVSEGTSKTTLQKDLSYLKRVWKDIHKRAGTEKAPSLIYAEPGLASRAVRDYLSEDVSEIWVDDAETAESMRAMTALLFPRRTEFVHLYENPSKSLWEHFNIRKQLEQVHAREVTLPSGGRLVFDQTEALMAVDINSGKSGGKNNFEATALRTNLEAAESIARQLRLRDVGGQVVIDFIEMRDQSRCREVEKTLHAAMKNDRARHDIGHMSSFGLLQIVRQRIGSSAISISQEPCPHCNGTGMRRNLEWQALQLLRELRGQMRLAARNGQTEYVCPLGAELAVYVLNSKRERLAALEKEFNLRLEIRIAAGEAN